MSWLSFFFQVDEYSRTNVPSIWAVGDVTNRANLTPVALMEGTCFAVCIFFVTLTLTYILCVIAFALNIWFLTRRGFMLLLTYFMFPTENRFWWGT